MSSTLNTKQSSETELKAQFRDAIIRHGIKPPSQIVADGQYQRFSTNDKHNDKAGWYVLDLSANPNGAFGCWRSGASHVWTPKRSDAISTAERELFHQRQKQSDRNRIEQQRKMWAVNAEHNKKLLMQTKAPGDAVRSYLATRGLGKWGIPECIRQHPGLVYWHKDENGALQDLGIYPAMLAPVINDGILVSVHRTYLYEGNKAPVPQPKKLTPASGRLTGGCIPLAQVQTGEVGIAEGIETAAAASLGSWLPVMAAYCANALAQFKWPQGTRRLIIFADNDDAGKDAALRLALRAKNFRLQTKILTPEQPGYDWANVWLEAQQ